MWLLLPALLAACFLVPSALPARPLTTIDAVLDGRLQKVHVFEGQDARMAARGFLAARGIDDASLLAGLTDAIAEHLAALADEQSGERRPSLTMDVTMPNGATTTVAHYDGGDLALEASVACSTVGASRGAELSACISKLVIELGRRLEAQRAADRAADAAVAAAGALDAAGGDDGALLVLPVVLRDAAAAETGGALPPLRFYFGDSPRAAAAAYVERAVGLSAADAIAHVKALAAEIEARLMASVRDGADGLIRSGPEFSLPLEVDGTAAALRFREGADPRRTAAAFCARFDLADAAFVRCARDTAALLSSQLARLREGAAAAVRGDGAVVVDEPRPDPTYEPPPLFSFPLSVGGDGKLIEVVMGVGDTPPGVAREFCSQHWRNITRDDSVYPEADLGMRTCTSLLEGTLEEMLGEILAVAPFEGLQLPSP